MRILYIKPTHNSAENENITAYLNEYKGSDTEITVWNASCGPKHLESPYYEAMAGPEILRMVRKAEAEGFDAAIIGCFYDPVLAAAREICTRMAVVAPAEASMSLAAMLGHTFSVIIGHDKWRRGMAENAHKYGHSGHLASFRSVGLGVLEFHLDPQETERRMRRAIELAIHEDLAEVIILGCTMQYGFYRELQAAFGVPVIDAMLAALKYAEMLVDVRNRAGWYTSKICSYKTPSRDEMRDWGMPD